MFRLSKATDYGIRILAHLAHDELEGEGARVHTAREVSEDLALPLPMVSKVMKSLARGGLLESHRGSKGGFSLTKRTRDLTVAGMIASLEGPVALTQCTLGPQRCEHEGSCSVQQPWNVINRAVQNTLATITLADLIHPGFPSQGSVLALGSPGPAGAQAASTGADRPSRSSQPSPRSS